MCMHDNVIEKCRGYYLETGPDPIAMVIRVELVIHKPTETNANQHRVVTRAGLC